ncbi:MAG: hypothetical protein QXK93_06825 [Candidatus Bathyarchaeia archaeon]
MKAVKKTIPMFYAIIILLPAIISATHAAEKDLNLPSEPVRIEVFDGVESYFLTKLLDVPEGYDVTNGTYLGWCIDTRTEMVRSPATHPARLYSSLNPPGELANKEWNMVNYILNNKPENVTVQDVQQAIWYFVNIDGNYTPTSQTAWQIINDALQYGGGFTPENGQVVAVICYPINLLPQPSGVQISIIEVEIKPAQESQPETSPEDGAQTKQPIEAWMLALIPIILVIVTLLFAVIIRRRKGSRQGKASSSPQEQP